LAHFRRLDIVVANAGVVPPWSDTDELDLDQLDEVFSINVRGVAATLKHGVAALKERGGAIVVMASLNAWRAHPSQPIYTASKHAVLGLLRTAALDAGRYGIRVNGLGPGPILTGALRERLERRAADGGLPVEQALRRRGGNSARTDGDGGGRRPCRTVSRQRSLVRDHRRAPARGRGHPLMLIHNE
jgi:NAD(P)-dependent dehydrogenase (short-subunit alcohol dehydrogenase family)